MKVVYEGKLIDLDPKNAIGDGGEANVIRHNNLAFKIYHDPTITRARKLTDFLKLNLSFSNDILMPIQLVMDTKGKIIGFTMNIAEKCKDMKFLMKPTFRNQNQIDSNDIIKFFISSKLNLDEINKQGIVVGDLNDLNQLYNDNFTSKYIDMDSVQFGNHPCLVGTDEYLDPNLYGVDLTKKPMFSQQTDWYSFAVLLFRTLLFSHPYAGVHKTQKSLFGRAKQKIWLFDSNVIRPKSAQHPETLSDDLLQIFERIFCKGDRIDIPVQLLKDTKFVKCTKCNVLYSNTRQKCPACQKVAPQQVDVSAIIINKQIGTEQCTETLIFGIEGVILFCKVISNSKLFIVYFNGKETRCRYIRDSFERDVKLFEGNVKNVVYDFFEPLYMVMHFQNDLMIFDISENKLIPVTKTVTMNYRNEPVFTCSDDTLYRLTSNAILKGTIRQGNLLEQEAMQAVENQTWFKVGQNGFGLGFYKIFEKYQYFVLSDKGRYELELEELEGQTIDIDVKISTNTLVLFRKNLHNGRTYSHLHIIDNKGAIVEKRSEESLSSDLLKNIYGKAFAGSVIIHPTDAGVATEKHGAVSLKTSTSNYVSAESKLFLYKQGILVVTDNKVSYLTLN